MVIFLAVAYIALTAMHMLVQGYPINEAMAGSGFEIIACIVAGNALGGSR